MSIVSRASSDYDEKVFPEGWVLINTAMAEKAISLIINDEDEAAVELATLLLVLELGIEAESPTEGPGRCPKTRNTIDMMVELAYLESRPYRCSLMKWREKLSARTSLRVEQDATKNSKHSKAEVRKSRKVIQPAARRIARRRS